MEAKRRQSALRGAATGLGVPPRLETRTKESNLHASRTCVNGSAERKRTARAGRGEGESQKPQEKAGAAPPHRLSSELARETRRRRSMPC